ncbi:MAG: ribonuclease P protein component [Oligosphaeraceae bacterium]|nr:ribonuclease P protein component [Oligosphaeraceae bacterium]
MSENHRETRKLRSPAFGKSARLTCQKSLQLVKSQGQKRSGRLCLVLILKTPPDQQRRVAFLISRRYALLAVQRNRARRLFREAFRQLYAQLPPLWLIMIPRQRMKHCKLPELLAELRMLLKEHLIDKAPTPGACDSSQH